MKQTPRIKDPQPPAPTAAQSGAAGTSPAQQALRGMDYQSQVARLAPAPAAPHRPRPHHAHAPRPQPAHGATVNRGAGPTSQAPAPQATTGAIGPGAQSTPGPTTQGPAPQATTGAIGPGAQTTPGPTQAPGGGGRQTGPDESVRTPRVVRPNLTQALQSFETGGARALASGFAEAGNPAGMALLRAAVVREIQGLSAERRSATVAVGATSTGEARELPIGGTLGTLAGQRAFVGMVDITMDEYGFVHVTTRQTSLGEHTLFARLGRYSSQQRRRETAADTELQTGALLGHLAQLQGRR